MSDIERPILEYISGGGAEAGGPAVTRDTPLLESGVLDSINLVRLVQFLEERFEPVADRHVTAHVDVEVARGPGTFGRRLLCDAAGDAQREQRGARFHGMSRRDAARHQPRCGTGSDRDVRAREWVSKSDFRCRMSNL